jgi:hypothetical protein
VDGGRSLGNETSFSVSESEENHCALIAERSVELSRLLGQVIKKVVFLIISLAGQTPLPCSQGRVIAG